jgi:hypothetical protein
VDHRGAGSSVRQRRRDQSVESTCSLSRGALQRRMAVQYS